jgi:hypothetical protein
MYVLIVFFVFLILYLSIQLVEQCEVKLDVAVAQSSNQREKTF